MNHFVAASLAWIATQLAQAGGTPVTHAFEPASPITTDFIRLRTDTQGCFSLHGQAIVVPQEPAIEVYFEGTDEACDPGIAENMQTPRYANVGMLPAGTYATRILSCGFGPMGRQCDVRQSGILVVANISADAITIPLMSWQGLSVLSCVFALLAMSRLRR